MTGELFEAECFSCGKIVDFNTRPPKKFACNDCKEKEASK
jgi:NAD-dependent SIR2 family protein deacetylase